MDRPRPLMPARVGTNQVVHLGMIHGRSLTDPQYEIACIGSRGPLGRAVGSPITCRNCIRGNGLVVSVAHANANLGQIAEDHPS